MVYLYNSIQSAESFSFSSLLRRGWYSVKSQDDCEYCYNDTVYLKSACNQCYNFLYNDLYDKQLCKYNMIKEILCHDICDIIVSNILMLIDINIQISHYKLLNLKNINENIPCLDDDIINENDLVTEDNMNRYVGSFYNDDDLDENYDDLGVWSDDEL